MMLRIAPCVIGLSVVLISGGCNSSRSNETILVSSIGSAPGTDRALFVRRSNGQVTNALTNRIEGFVQFASARQKGGPYLAYLQGAPSLSTGLYQISGTGEPRSVPLPYSGLAAQGEYDPIDPKTIVLSVSSVSNPRQYSLYLFNGIDFKRLTVAPDQSWDYFPVFRADGRSVAFIRARLTNAGVATKLLSVATDSMQTQELISESEGVAAASYSPTGNKIIAWTHRGLEVIPDDNTADQNLLLPTDWLNGRFVDAVTWSLSGTEAFFAVRNNVTQESEMFSIPVDKPADPMNVAHLPSGRVTALRAVQ